LSADAFESVHPDIHELCAEGGARETLDDHPETINPEEIGAFNEKIKDVRDGYVSVAPEVAEGSDCGEETVGTGLIGC
jgi:hypothetical protein